MGPRPIVEVFAETVDSRPSASAVTCAGARATFRALDERSNRLGRAYASLGVEQGSRVSICLPNGIEFLEAALAAWKLGATPQPLSPDLPDPELRRLLAVAEPALLVGRARFPGGPVSIAAGFQPDSSLGVERLPMIVSPEIKAMASGGSTGQAKLIVANRPAVIDLDRPPRNMRADQVQLIAGPLYHNASFVSLFGLMLGQHVVVLPRFDPSDALTAIEEHRVSVTTLVPTMMLRMWRLIEREPARFDLSSLEAIWHMGGPCAPWLKEAWISLVGPERMFEVYGGTEEIGTTRITGTEWLAHRGSVGRLPVGEMRVCDEQGRDVLAGVVGEIYMRRSGLDAPPYRYLGDGAARTLPDGWQSLGDLGWVDGDGYLYLADRRSDVIVSGGANVYAAEVESAITEHPDVLSCAVVGLPDDDLGHRVHAVVEAPPSLDPTELITLVGERLARYKVPRSIRVVDHPLRDDAGKVRRSAIRDHEIALSSAL